MNKKIINFKNNFWLLFLVGMLFFCIFVFKPNNTKAQSCYMQVTSTSCLANSQRDYLYIYCPPIRIGSGGNNIDNIVYWISGSSTINISQILINNRTSGYLGSTDSMNTYYDHAPWSGAHYSISYQYCSSGLTGCNPITQYDAWPNIVCKPIPGPFTAYNSGSWCENNQKIIKLTWSASSNVEHYRIYDYNTGYWIGTTTNREFTISGAWGLSPNETHSYRIIAVNSTGSTYSNVVSFGPINCQWWNGYHDGQSGTQTSTSSCNANGWAVDTNAKSTSIYVDVYVDKTAQQAYNEGYANSGSYSRRVLANLERSDVCNDHPDYSTGGSCRHGFNLNLANTFPNIFSDNNSHTVYVYPIKATGDGDGSILNTSPKTIRCTSPSPTISNLIVSSSCSGYAQNNTLSWNTTNSSRISSITIQSRKDSSSSWETIKTGLSSGTKSYTDTNQPTISQQYRAIAYYSGTSVISNTATCTKRTCYTQPADNPEPPLPQLLERVIRGLYLSEEVEFTTND